MLVIVLNVCGLKVLLYRVISFPYPYKYRLQGRCPISLQNTGCPISLQNTWCPISLQIIGCPISLPITGCPISLQITWCPISLQTTGCPISLQISRKKNYNNFNRYNILYSVFKKTVNKGLQTRW